MSDTTHKPLGHCEECSKPIMPGDVASYGGPDDLWLCEDHSYTIKDQVNWLREVLEDGSWSDEDFGFDSEDEVRNLLARFEAELAATGNRTMATVHHV